MGKFLSYNPELPSDVSPGQISDGYHTFDELYEHRHLLFCALARNKDLSCWRSRLHDDGSRYGGYFIAGIKLPTGDITYHLPNQFWDLLNHASTLDRAPTWDGHTSLDVLDRLKDYLL